jgi:phospholipid/cholesterol/gamma-HCH transport system substrate-binding protein
MPRTRSVAWSELKLGMVGVIAIVLASALILAVGGQGGFFWQRYPLRARFDDVVGLKAGAVVRVNGMEVGKVTAVEFQGTEVEVTLELSRSVRPLVTSESEASMGTLSLLGEPIIVIRAAEAGTPLADGALLRTVSGRGMAELATVATGTAEEVIGLVEDLRAGRGSAGRLFTDDALYEEVELLAASVSRIAIRLDEGGGTLGALTADRAAYESLTESLDNLRAFSSRVANGNGTLGMLVDDRAMGHSLTRASSSLDEITGRLARGEGTAGQLLTDRALYDRLNALSDRLERISGKLDQGNGTAARVLNDAQLYDNVNQTAAELRALVADIRKDRR